MQGCRGGEVVFLGQWEEGTGSVTGLKTSSGRGRVSSDAETLGLRTLHPFTSQPLMRGVGEWGTGVVGGMLESAPSGNADGVPPPPSPQSAVASTQRHMAPPSC